MENLSANKQSEIILLFWVVEIEQTSQLTLD